MLPNQYLLSALHSLLGPYLTRLRSQQVKVGLWSGELELQHLELQRLSWQQEGTVVSVLQGTVDRVHVELPWSKESQGSVRAHVSGVDVMIKVVFDRSYAPTSHAKHQPDVVDEEEEDAGATRGMFDDPLMLGKLTEIVQQQVLWRLFRRLGASLHDIRVTCVVPFYTPSHEFAVVQLSLQELDMQPIELGLPRFGFQASAKDFRLQGLKLDLGVAIIPPVFNDHTGSEFEYADNDIIAGVRRLHMTSLLNPLCIAGSLAYQPATTLTDLPTLSGNVEIGPIMLTPTIDQLHLLSEGSKMIQLELRNLFVRHLRPTESVMNAPQLWWRYAFQSVVMCAGLSKRPQLGLVQAMRKLRLRNKYLRLLRRGLAARAGRPIADRSSKTVDRQIVAELHMYFDLAEVIAMRMAARRSWEEDEAARLSAKRTGIDGWIPSALVRLPRTAHEGLDALPIAFDWMEHEADADPLPVALNVTCSLKRFSLSVIDSHGLSMLTAGVAGVRGSVERASVTDRYYRINVASAFVFGQDGVEIFRSGRALHESGATHREDFAVQCNVQWYDIPVELVDELLDGYTVTQPGRSAHIVMQASLAAATVCYDAATVSRAARTLLPLQFGLDTLPSVVPFQELRMLCARSSHAHRLSIDRYLKVSADVSLDGLLLRVPCGGRGYCVDVDVQGATFHSGDVLFSMVSPKPQPARPTLLAINSWAPTEDLIVNRVLANQHPTVVTMLVGVDAVDISIRPTDQASNATSLSLTREPLSLRCVMAASRLPVDPRRPKLNVAVFGSPVLFTVSGPAMSLLLDAATVIGQADFWPSPASADPSCNEPPPRIKRLSGLCVLRLEAFVESISCCVVDPAKFVGSAQLEANARNILGGYADALSSHHHPRAAAVAREVAARSLALLGVPDAVANDHLARVQHAIEHELHSRDEAVENASYSLMLAWASSSQPQRSYQIVTMSLDAVCYQRTALLYDSHDALEFGQVVVSSGDGTPLVVMGGQDPLDHVQSRPQAPVLPQPRRPVRDKRLTARLRLEEEATALHEPASPPAFACSFVCQDLEHGWGQGGQSSHVLYPMNAANRALRTLDLSVSARVKSLWIVVCPSSILKISEALLPIVHTVVGTGASGSRSAAGSQPAARRRSRRLSFVAKRTVGPPPQRPPRCTVAVSLRSATVVMRHEQRLLGELQLGGLTGSFNDSEFLQQMCVSVKRWAMHDLTVLGSHHGSLLWDDCDAEDVIAIRTTSNKFDQLDVDVAIQRLRVCFVNRFVLELVDYFQLRLIEPLLDAVARSKPVRRGSGSNRASPTAPPSQSTTAAATSYQLFWVATLRDAVIYIPRNTASDDMAALHLSEAECHNSWQSSSWVVPNSAQGAVQLSQYQDQSNTAGDKEHADIWDDSFVPQQGQKELRPVSRRVSSFSKSTSILSWDESEECDISPREPAFYDAREVETATANRNKFERISLAVKHADIFVALDRSKRRKAKGALRLARLRDGGPVFVGNHSRHHTWHKITTKPFALGLLLDLIPSTTRILLGEDPAHPAQPFELQLSMSMGEFYMAMCVWFDNMQELPVFIKVPLVPPAQEFSDWPTYGTREYVRRLSAFAPTVEFAVCASLLDVEGLYDASDFPFPVPSSPYVGHAAAEASTAQPLFRILTKRAVFHLCRDAELLNMAVGVGAIAAFDLRQRPRTQFSRTLHAAKPFGAGRRTSAAFWTGSECDVDEDAYTAKRGFADLTFGLEATPSNLTEPLPLPAQLSLFYPPNGWITINVGMDNVDILMKELGMVWIISDFFSRFFREAQYGHPGLKAMEDMAHEHVVSDGGVDVRVFVTRPHIGVVENVLNTVSQTLVIEEANTVYFRYLYDTQLSVRMEARLSETAAVLVKSYRNPSTGRGVRGTSGSGKGVRTLVEWLSVSTDYFFHAPANHLDVKARIPAPPPTSAAYEGFDHDALAIQPQPFSDPTCLSADGIPPRLVLSNTCNIVSSYEDLMFAVTLIQELLWAGADPSAASPPPTDDAVEVETTSDGQSTIEMKEDEEEQHEKSSDSTKRSHEQRQDGTAAAAAAQAASEASSREPMRKLHKGQVSSLSEPSEPAPSKPRPQDANWTITSYAEVSSICIIFVDPVLGLHLPIARALLAQATLVYDRVYDQTSRTNSPAEVKQHARKLTRGVSTSEQSLTLLAAQPLDLDTIVAQATGKAAMTTRSSAKLYFWVDYFNGTLKCWEPLLEPIHGFALYRYRTDADCGLVVRFPSPVHCNVSAAFITTVADALRIISQLQDVEKEVQRMRQETLVAEDAADRLLVSEATRPIDRRIRHRSPSFANPQQLLRRRGSVTSTTRRQGFVGPDEPFLHEWSQTLAADARVGFSILNLTGQSVRYLQRWESDRSTIQYLAHGKRGLLNFLASLTILRNCAVTEVPFEVQLDRYQMQKRGASHIGHRVSIQVSGFRWLWSIPADFLGLHFYELTAVLGTLNVSSLADWRLRNALQLAAEVTTFNGGRLLTLKSVFQLRNNTDHDLSLLVHQGVPDTSPNEKGARSWFRSAANSRGTATGAGVAEADADGVIAVSKGDIFHVPLLLLHQSLLQAQQQRHNKHLLGCISLKPRDHEMVGRQLGSMQPGNPPAVQFSSQSVDLHAIVSRTAELFAADQDEDDDRGIELSCPVSQPADRTLGDALRGNLVSESTALPPFSYCVEVQRSPVVRVTSHAETERLHHSFGWPRRTQSDDRRVPEARHGPVMYTLVVHPPIIIENLLPFPAVFSLVHTEQERVVWRSLLEAGATKSIYSVGLTSTLSMSINLGFCRTLDGAIVHVGEEVATRVIGRKFRQEHREVAKYVFVTDGVGQRLRLQIDNQVGGGGHRRILVYCPYWIVNTTQYSIRLKQDTSDEFPAGTVSSNGDGSKLLEGYGSEELYTLRTNAWRAEGSIFPGKPGPLDPMFCREISNNTPHRALASTLSAHELAEMAFMFNYDEDEGLLASRKVTVQVDESEWSKSFSLESVGVSQSLNVYGAHGNIYDLGFKVTLAPGKLGKYTKILRFWPRYVLVNNLGMPVKVQQYLGMRPSQAITDVSGQCSKPFHLPVAMAQRLIALDMHGWRRSIFFGLDDAQDYMIKLEREYEFGEFAQVPMRSGAEYDVELPAQEVGLWLETDWDHKTIVVKECKRGGYCATYTDIQRGDELLAIAGEPVGDKSFEAVLSLLREKLRTTGCVVRFRTVEERIRLVRLRSLTARDPESKAKRASQLVELPGGPSSTSAAPSQELAQPLTGLSDNTLDAFPIKIELKPVEASVFVVLRPVDAAMVEYRVENNTSSHYILYKQKQTRRGRWNVLGPGESAPYIWEDVLKPHKLQVVVGPNLLLPAGGGRNDAENAVAQLWHNIAGPIAGNENMRTVDFDEIGFSEKLPIVSGPDLFFAAKVSSEGPTKVLKICLDESVHAADAVYSTRLLEAQMEQLGAYVRALEGLREVTLSARSDRNLGHGSVLKLSHLHLKGMQDVLSERQQELLNEAREALAATALNISEQADIIPAYERICRPLGTVLTSTHQLFLEVLEARGLRLPSKNGPIQPYCEAYLKFSDPGYRPFRQKQSTYACEQTRDPTWYEQRFTFNIPEDAVTVPRGFWMRIKLLNRDVLGLDQFLGLTDIPLSLLHDQVEREGWFELKPHRHSLLAAPTQSVTGAIRLRVQWVYSESAFVEHHRKEGQLRLQQLKQYHPALKRQLRGLRATRSTRARRAPISSLREAGRELSQRAAQRLRDTTQQFSHHIRKGTLMLIGKHVEGGDVPLENSLSRSLSVETGKPGNSGSSSSNINAYVDLQPPNPKPLPTAGTVRGGRVLGSSSTESSGDVLSPALLRRGYSVPEEPRNRSTQHLRSQSPEVAVETRWDVFASSGARRSITSQGAHHRRFFSDSSPSHSRVQSTLAKHRSEQYSQSFLREMRRYEYLSTMTGGRIEITPVKVMYLNTGARHPLHARIRYGDIEQRTFSTRPAAHPTWFDESQGEPRLQTLPKSFAVDTVNIRGPIRVSVWMDGLVHDTELGRIELAIVPLLSCVATSYPGYVYERWFPLMAPQDWLQIEDGWGDASRVRFAEQSDPRGFESERQAIVQLRIRWFPDEITTTLSVAESLAHFNADFAGFSLSVIDSDRSSELLQIGLSDIDARVAMTAPTTTVSLNINWVQIDNQLEYGSVPVILAPTPVPFPQPVVRFSLKRNNLLSHEHLNSFETIELILQELDLKLEQFTILACWDFASSLISAFLETSSGKSGELSLTQQPSAGSFEAAALTGAAQQRAAKEQLRFQQMTTMYQKTKKIYVDNLMIGPIKVNVSFITNSSVVDGTLYRRSHGDVFDNQSIGSWFTSARLMGEVILDLTSSISDAPVILNGLQVSNLFKTTSEIAHILQDHYFNTALRQVYKIVGSLDFMGNPIGLVSSLGVGVRDFFYEPAHGLITSPAAFGKGVVRGTVSLVTNTAAGAVGAAARITGSLGRGVASLTMDSDFLRRREQIERQGGRFSFRPVKDIGFGVYHGVTGVFMVPYREVKKQGPKGVVVGITKGVAGLAAKPVVGVLDAISHTGDAVREAAKIITLQHHTDPIRRMRLAHAFGLDGRVLPYSTLESRGAYILQQLARTRKPNELRPREGSPKKRRRQTLDGQTAVVRRASASMRETRSDSFELVDAQSLYNQESVLLTEILLKTDLVVIVTTERVLLVKYSRGVFPPASDVQWELHWSEIGHPSLDNSGTTMYLGDVRSSLSNVHTSTVDFTLTGDYFHKDAITNIYNCLCSVKRFFHDIRMCARTVALEDKVVFGAWEFGPHVEQHQQLDAQEIDELQRTMWIHAEVFRQRYLPSWLEDAHEEAMEAHEHIRQLIEEAKVLRTDPEVIVQCKLQLTEGRISYREFKKIIERNKELLQHTAPAAFQQRTTTQTPRTKRANRRSGLSRVFGLPGALRDVLQPHRKAAQDDSKSSEVDLDSPPERDDMSDNSDLELHDAHEESAHSISTYQLERAIYSRDSELDMEDNQVDAALNRVDSGDEPSEATSLAIFSDRTADTTTTPLDARRPPRLDVGLPQRIPLTLAKPPVVAEDLLGGDATYEQLPVSELQSHLQKIQELLAQRGTEEDTRVPSGRTSRRPTGSGEEALVQAASAVSQTRFVSDMSVDPVSRAATAGGDEADPQELDTGTQRMSEYFDPFSGRDDDDDAADLADGDDDHQQDGEHQPHRLDAVSERDESGTDVTTDEPAAASGQAVAAEAEADQQNG